jgi:hypothetical protein
VARIFEFYGRIYPGRLDWVLGQLLFELCEFFVDLGASLLCDSNCWYKPSVGHFQEGLAETIGNKPSH